MLLTMGMAASQARLLSITSRMSDNELRAQLINNAKIRLSTESSQVSDAYIAALNETQYMFTNYDADNKATYQSLTFNSLTAYNEFNNQYGLSNAAGQILVSERDGKRYEDANGDLEAFLKSYGLENRTTYFETLEDQEVGGLVQLDTVRNSNGTITTNYSPYSAAEIEEIYNGNQKAGGIHAGYENSLVTKDFNDYIKLQNTYQTAKDDYDRIIVKVMKEYLNGVSANGITYEQLTNYLNGGDTKDSIKYFEAFSGMIDQINADGKFSADRNYGNPAVTFYSYMKQLISDATYENNHTTRTFSTTGVYSKDENGNSVLSIPCDNECVFNMIKDNATGLYSYELWDGDEEIEAAYYSATMNGNNCILTMKDGNGTATNTYTFNNVAWSGTPTGTQNLTYKETLLGDYKNEVYFDNLSQLVKYLEDNYKNALNDSQFTQNAANSPQYKDVYDAYVDASKAMAEFIFGNPNAVTFDDYDKLDDYKWVHDRGGTTTQYQPAADVLAIEDVFKVYGEPLYAYIKDGDYNANGDAEAKWYTNLFNRMEKGYKVLENGLATSSEWIKYALESGLVKMEQVDKNQTWNSITYSSCSDITEQTSDLAVTIAEAEYNKAMSKIENKDKAYDTELKNIDTEHSALQTEYDSIQSALDKNIERNFKLYS